MSFNIQTASLTGNPDFQSWSQVKSFEQQIGKLYICLSLTGKEDEDNAFLGNQILSQIGNNYSSEKGTYLSLLKNLVQQIFDRRILLLSSLEISAFAFIEGACYMVAAGGAKVIIFRNGKLVTILDSNNKVSSASGYPEKEDIFVIGSSDFFNRFSDNELKEALSKKNLETAVEHLAPGLQTSEKSAKCVSFFIKFTIQEKPEVNENRLGGKIDFSKTPLIERKLKIVSHSGKKNIFRHPLSILKKIFPQRKIYIKEETSEALSHNKKLSASVGIILIILLILSIVFGIKQKKQRDYKEIYQSKVEEAVHELTEAEEIYSINPIRARELFVQSNEKIESLLEQGIKDSEVEKIKLRLDEDRGKILREYLSSFDLFIDLSLLSSGFKGDFISVSDETVYVLDKENERVVGVSTVSKRSEVIAGPDQIDQPQGLASYSDRVFIVNSKGIFGIGSNFDKVVDNTWKGEVLIYSYTGNLYVLDKGESVIWRYSGGLSGFSSGAAWLSEHVAVDLSNAKTWVIDGAVWILTESGKILKFSLGNPQSFVLSGIFPEVASPNSIYTNDELAFFYILESTNKRVVVVSKEGDYVAQYFSDRIAEVKDIAVSEKEKKLILLTGDKLYSIDLKHI